MGENTHDVVAIELDFDTILYALDGRLVKTSELTQFLL